MENNTNKETNAETSKLLMLGFAKSAEQGDDEAQFNLGLCYCKGYGTPIEPKKGMELICMSAEQGNEKAITLAKKLLEGYERKQKSIGQRIMGFILSPFRK